MFGEKGFITLNIVKIESSTHSRYGKSVLIKFDFEEKRIE